jgi:hypothetical protein
MIKQVQNSRKKQEELKEYEKRMQKARFNLFPRTSKSIAPTPPVREKPRELALRAMARTFHNSKDLSPKHSE